MITKTLFCPEEHLIKTEFSESPFRILEHIYREDKARKEKVIYHFKHAMCTECCRPYFDYQCKEGEGE